MVRFKGIVGKIQKGWASILLDDGIEIRLPISCLPAKIVEGAMLNISISEDRIAALLKKAKLTPLQKERAIPLPRGQ